MGQRPRGFADPGQRLENRRKQHWVMRNGIRKAFAGEHRGADLGDHRPQPPDINVRREQFERVIEPGAGLQQQRQIEREDGDIFGARPPPEPKPSGRRGRGAILGHAVDWDETEIFDAVGDFCCGRRRDRAAHEFAALRQRPISKARHGVTRRS